MTITPEQLAAAEKIDVGRYAGHTPWLCVDNHVVSKGDGNGQWFLYDSSENDDPPIGTAHHYDQAANGPNARLWADAPLIPALVHQRDRARHERDHYRAERDRLARVTRMFIFRRLGGDALKCSWSATTSDPCRCIECDMRNSLSSLSEPKP